MVLRLKIEQGKVSEIETTVTPEAEQKRFYNPKTLFETKDQDWTTPLPAEKRLTREHMNEGANKYFDAFSNAPPPPTGGCSPKGLVLTHTHRRFLVADLELGVTADFINFNQALPDVHIFKYNAHGKISLSMQCSAVAKRA